MVYAGLQYAMDSRRVADQLLNDTSFFLLQVPRSIHSKLEKYYAIDGGFVAEQLLNDKSFFVEH